MAGQGQQADRGDNSPHDAMRANTTGMDDRDREMDRDSGSFEDDTAASRGAGSDKGR